jgi:hypothetical protein
VHDPRTGLDLDDAHRDAVAERPDLLEHGVRFGAGRELVRSELVASHDRAVVPLAQPAVAVRGPDLPHDIGHLGDLRALKVGRPERPGQRRNGGEVRCRSVNRTIIIASLAFVSLAACSSDKLRVADTTTTLKARSTTTAEAVDTSAPDTTKASDTTQASETSAPDTTEAPATTDAPETTEAETSAPETTDAPTTEAPTTTAVQGTHANPFRGGQALSTDKYNPIVFTGPLELVSDDALHAANPYNDPAPAGQAYVRFKMSATYIGPDTGNYFDFYEVGVVGSKGKIYTQATVTDSSTNGDLEVLNDAPEVITGGTLEGYLYFLVDTDDTALLVISKSADGNTFIDLSPST